MPLTMTARCATCPNLLEVEAASLTGAGAVLRRAGWTVRSFDQADICPHCAAPSRPEPPEPKVSPPEPTPIRTLADLLYAGGFMHESGAEIWKSGPDFVWLENMFPDREWIEGAEFCCRIKYVVGQAKSESQIWEPPTARDHANLDEGLRRLAGYLAEHGYQGQTVEPERGMRHLIAYR
ncbi:hypothetical protein ACFYNY_34475 [Streptomyces sp. NPDC006530]|uniref:hypothetical protein n=1 Tax=Streptomyces sp. NPDC006530 TaxID=3364750 RepID=UPI0036B5FEC4